MASHIFDITEVKLYGVNAAIILHNIRHLVTRNAANNIHFHDGKYWTYNSKKAFCELFPYLTENQIRFAIDALVAAGVLFKGCFNQNKFDKTSWYSCAFDWGILADRVESHEKI